MDKIVIKGEQFYLVKVMKENPGQCCFWGLVVLIFLIIIVCCAVFCCAQNDDQLMTDLESTFKFDRKDLDKLTRKMKENFAPALPIQQRIRQPQVFKREILSVPGNCHPFLGCFYPSYMSNPVSLKSGKRKKAVNEDKIWCEKSWRDCGIYQDCVNGKCEPKKGVYPLLI